MNTKHGTVNPNLTLNSQGITGFNTAYYNLTEPDLISQSLYRDEGELGIGGALLVETGKFTGRSPKDKHIVVSEETADKVWWERNAKMSSEAFDELHKDMLKHIQGKDLFVQDLYGGADPKYRIGVRVITEYSWHNLFIRHLLIRPTGSDLETYINDFSIINLPSFSANPTKHGCKSETVIAINFDKRLVLIGGTEYAGENKKAVFTILNYLLPEVGVMPMHCSANVSKEDPEQAAIFFGPIRDGKDNFIVKSR